MTQKRRKVTMVAEIGVMWLYTRNASSHQKMKEVNTRFSSRNF